MPVQTSLNGEIRKKKIRWGGVKGRKGGKKKKTLESPIPGVEPGSLPATSMRGQYDNRYTIWDPFLMFNVGAHHGDRAYGYRSVGRSSPSIRKWILAQRAHRRWVVGPVDE